MRNIFTLFLLVLISLASRAQTQKKTISLGAALSFNRQAQENENGQKYNTTSLNFNPSIGWFYRDNHLAGINLFYAGSKAIGGYNKYNNIGIGPFLRQYLLLGKSFYLLAEEGVFGNYARFVDGLSNVKQFSTGAYFYPGIAYSFTRKFQIELAYSRLVSLNYQTEKRTIPDVNGNIRTSSLFLNAGSGVNLNGSLAFAAHWMLF